MSPAKTHRSPKRRQKPSNWRKQPSRVLANRGQRNLPQSCTWRVVEGPNGTTLINILNIGKHSAKLTLNNAKGKGVNSINMLTSQTVGSSSNSNRMAYYCWK